MVVNGDEVPDYEPKQMRLSFNENEKDQIAAYDYLIKLSNEEKVSAISKIVRSYWNSGYDKEYIEYRAENLLKSFAIMYELENDDKILKNFLGLVSIADKLPILPGYVNASRLSIDPECVLAAVEKAGENEKKSK